MVKTQLFEFDEACYLEAEAGDEDLVAEAEEGLLFDFDVEGGSFA